MKKNDALHCQQSLLRTPGVKEDFEEALGAIQASVSNPNKTTCQLCYAWPSEENKVTEYWVQPFLLELRRHLRLAGIQASLDIADNQSGGDIRQFAKQARTCDYTLLFCTPSLVTKLDVGKAQHVIQLEFNHLKEKLKNDGSQVKVFPFLIAGTPEESAPPEFKTFVTTREWQGKSYVHCLKDLINAIYPTLGDQLNGFMEKHIGFKTPLTNSQVETELQKRQYEQEQAKLEQADWYQRLKALQGSVTAEEIFVARQKYGVPNRNEKFVGRVEHLKRIEDQFKQSKNTETDTEAASPVVITAALNGMGGVGKSQLALQYVYTHEEQYSKIFWFIAETADRLKQEYQSLGLELKLYPEEAKLDDAVRITKNWLEQTNDWLAVYDNVPNYTEIRSLLPQKNGCILITSRYTHWSISNKNILPIKVDVFSEEEALLFMREQLKERMESEEEVIASKELLSLLGNLPLALAQASAYMNQSVISVQEYLELYKVYRKDFLERNDLEGEAEPEVVAIALTWKITLERIRTIKPEAEMLLNFLSYLSPDQIPVSLLHEFTASKNITNVLDVRDIINILVNYSMLKREEDQSYSIHRLVQEVLRDKHSMEEGVSYLLDLSNIMQTIYPEVDLRTAQTELKKVLIPHIEQGLALSNRLLEKLEQPEKKSNTEDQAQVSTEAFVESVEKETKGYLLHILAEFHCIQGQAEKARAYWDQQLKIKRKYYGNDRVEVAKTLNNLAIAEGFLGNSALSKEYLLESLRTQRAYYGNDHVEVARTLNNFANVESALGNYAIAKENLEESLRIQRAHYGDNHVEVSNTLCNLGHAESALGNYLLAKKYFKQAIRIRKAYYGSDHVEVARVLNNLANAESALGNHALSKEYWEQSLSVVRQYYVDDHVEVAIALSNLATAEGVLGNNELAKKYLKEMLRINRVYYGDDHVEVANALNNLAIVEGALGNHGLKKEYLEQSLRIQGAYYGDDHVVVAKVLENLGNTEGALGNHGLKKEYLEQSLRMKRGYYGEDHSEVAKTLENLAKAYLDLGVERQHRETIEKAKSLAEESLKIFQHHANCGPNHPYTKKVEHNLRVIESELANVISFSVTRMDLHEILPRYKTSQDTFFPTPETALRRAASQGNVEDVKALLEYVSDMNIQDTNPRNQKTALHWAVKGNYVDVVKLLLDSGASKDIPDSSGKTAEDYMRESDVEEMRSFADRRDGDSFRF